MIPGWNFLTRDFTIQYIVNPYHNSDYHYSVYVSPSVFIRFLVGSDQALPGSVCVHFIGQLKPSVYRCFTESISCQL